MSVLKKSAAEQAKALAAKEISASELVKAHYEQIKAVDKDVKAFLYLDEKMRSPKLNKLIKSVLPVKSYRH
jgi:Asp-tRNA(Asn)/Glu-tRNA(Gln) amidotransferase A subunit family amidase